MKLVVGLGNPGKKYENTRHNCGFNAIDFYAEKNQLTFKNRFNALYVEQVINNEKFIFVKPQTFMNLSGTAVRQFVNFYNINVSDILVIYDDMDFDVGVFKVKKGGSAAGHNGIKNIIENLGTSDIPRIRIGISKEYTDKIDFVIGKFSKEDKSKIDELFPIICNIITDFSNMSLEKIMDKYNGLCNER